MTRRFAALREALLNLLYPRRAVCMGCGSMLGCDRDDLCEECWARLAKNWIGASAPSGGRTSIDGAACAYAYPGPAGALARNLKYRGVWVLARDMGADVARAAALLRLPPVKFVAAVPMHPKRLRRRGKNHAELLARRAAECLELDYADILLRTRDAPQQARLGAGARRKSPQGGFAVRQECRSAVAGADVLLIDDV